MIYVVHKWPIRNEFFSKLTLVPFYEKNSTEVDFGRVSCYGVVGMKWKGLGVMSLRYIQL